MLMTNGIGPSLGMIAAQAVVNAFTGSTTTTDGATYTTGDWSTVWTLFSAYSLVVAVLFALIFRYKHTSEYKKQ
jgi:hypothetical protein